MQGDIEALKKLNQDIGAAEDRGDRDWLGGILAPRLAFQRADEEKTVDDQLAFLQKVKKKKDSDPCRETEILEPIEVEGDRAIVKCVVTVGTKKFHNLRLFVRRVGQWKLLGWANEPR